ncbi:hypothetical protein [Glaciihabitans sp. UYNi722]|uniref:hypothetical protein n=1 Tax=Glaciihabitans sp. UYNi722 TaxID=3156344 RepID=UPI003394700A
MAFFTRDDDNPLPKDDRGTGSFNQYKYNLLPSSGRVTLRLAASNPCQDELQKVADNGEDNLETAISRRSIEDERTDAPMVIRLFAGSRVTGIVGTVPRGLESIVDEALSRLDKRGQKVRIPARLAKTRSGWRVDLLMGQTR